MNEQYKRNIKRPRRKSRVRWKRVIGASALAIGLLAGAATGIKALVEDDNTIYIEENLENIQDCIDSEFDMFREVSYLVNEPIGLFVEGTRPGEIKNIDTIQQNQNINIYEMAIKEDVLGNGYYYCEVPESNEIGLVKIDDLSKTTKVSINDGNFSKMFQINPKTESSIEIQATIGENGQKSGFEVKPGEIIFADSLNAKVDEKDNMWIKIRTNSGNIGYIKNDESIMKKIEDGVLVEVISDSDKILKVNSQNLNTNTENMISDIEPGNRLVVVGEGKNSETSYAVYFDDNGNAKWGEINNELLKEVELTSDKHQKIGPKQISNDVESMNININNWLQNYQTGAFGIDISASMTPEGLEEYLNNTPNVEYGIIRLGVSGYGKNFSFADTSTVTLNEDTKNLVKGQIEEFKKKNIPVFGYFYATDTNPEEGYQIATEIEKCIDELGGNIQPIVDCEVFDEGRDDRMYFLTQPNYDAYGGEKIDFDYLRSLSELELLEYVDNNPNVQNYIEFCQDKKAESLASIYKKLYNDGYIQGKNAILYTGNKSVSKDSYKATIQTADCSFEKIVLFKYDDVVEYLTNPDSLHFISEDFNLKVWYADYTSGQNFKMLGEGSVMAQYNGDVDVGDGNLIDENYACKAFIDEIAKAQKTEKQYININDDLELG